MENKIKSTEEKELDEAVKKVQKVSVSYTLKSFGENIKKFESEKIATAEETKQLKALHKTLVERWIGTQFNL